MKRIVGGNKQWCSTADSSLCDENKFTLSRLMCGSDEIVEATTEAQGTGEQAEPSGSEPQEESAQVATATESEAEPELAEAPAPGIDVEALRTNLLKEQVQIEEQRILLEEKRIELAQRELELKRQLSN